MPTSLPVYGLNLSAWALGMTPLPGLLPVGTALGLSMAGSDVFGDLRALRSLSPGWAGSDEARRAVFAAAMEPSEAPQVDADGGVDNLMNDVNPVRPARFCAMPEHYGR